MENKIMRFGNDSVHHDSVSKQVCAGWKWMFVYTDSFASERVFARKQDLRLLWYAVLHEGADRDCQDDGKDGYENAHGHIRWTFGDVLDVTEIFLIL